jgi:hypothetical protein
MGVPEPHPTTLPLVRTTPNPGGQLALNDIVGRNARLADASTALLDDGRNLLLDEPRRFGKSSFAHLLVDAVNATTSHSAVYHSVQGDTTIQKVVTSLLGAVREVPGGRRNAIASALKSFLREVNVGPLGLSVAFEQDPLAALRASMTAIERELERTNSTLVICLDELTETIAEIAANEGAEKARELLGELRRVRETHSHIRWLLTGSIGFHHVLRTVGATASMTNDTRRFPLGPLDPGWAVWLAGSVLWGAGVEPGTDEATRVEIARVTDGIPMLIHLVGQYVRDERLASVDAADMAEILDTCFRRQDLNANMTHFLTRLEQYYPNDFDAAERVLDRVADGPATRRELDAFDGVTGRLLDALEDDHYLGRNDANLVVWKYPSLARLWRIRRGRP